MVIIKPEWVGFELYLSHVYPDNSKWGMTYSTLELDHVDTGYSDKVVKVDCDAINVELIQLRTRIKELEIERDLAVKAVAESSVVESKLRAERDRLRDALEPFARFECGCGECYNCIARKAIKEVEG